MQQYIVFNWLHLLTLLPSSETGQLDRPTGFWSLDAAWCKKKVDQVDNITTE